MDAVAAPARYRWTVLGVGTFAAATFSTVAVGLPALAPALRDEYGLDLPQTGVVLGAVGVGMLFTLLPWGLLADRVGERIVLAAGLAGGAAALAACAFAPDFAWLTALLVVSGLLGASVNAASGRAVVGWFDSSERGFALGIRQTAIPIGGASAAATLPWLAGASGTRGAFLTLAAVCAVGAIAGAVWVREAPPIDTPHASDAARPLRDPRMWILATGSALLLVAQVSTLGFAVLFLHDERGLSPGAAAAVLACFQVLGGIARVATGRWSDRVGTRMFPLRAVALLLTLAMAATAAAVDAPLVVLVPVLIVAGALGMSWNGLSFTAAAETAGRRHSGAAIGLQQTVLGAGVAAYPIAFAAAVDAASWRLRFAAAAVASLLGYALLMRL